MNEDRLIRFELAKLNAHLPEKRTSLREALSSEKPRVISRNGNVHVFKRAELELLSKLLSEEDWDKLRLPILIMLDPKLGKGSARIRGRTEVRVVSQVLGKRGSNDEMLIYRPEVAILRGKFPTTTQYFFML